MKNKNMMTGSIFAISLLLNGCHSYQNVSVKQQSLGETHYYLTEPPLYAGDKIKYQLRTGETGELTVASVSSKAINGTNHITLYLNNLSSLEKLEISNAKTGAAVASGTAATVVIVGVMLSFAITGAIVAAMVG